jgi:hypothetical protein
MPSETKRLRQDGKVKKIVVDLSLDKEMLQDVIRRKLCLSGSGNWWIILGRLGN